MPRFTASRPALQSVLLLALAAFCAPAHSAPKKPAPPQPASLLPAAFGEWHATGKPAESSDPKTADPANAAALAEYGLQRFSVATYTDPAGDTLTIRADQFPDATGAYGAFTFYRQPEMQKQKQNLGADAASAGNHLLFWQGAVLVYAQFSRPEPRMAGQLQPLSAVLPKISGTAAILPPLAAYLPSEDLQKGSEKYALGPAAYAASGGVLPVNLVGFDMGSEAITARYATRRGNGTLTVLDCPTMQLAANRLRDILSAQGAAAAAAAASAPSHAVASAAFAANRSGTMVAIASGSFSPEEAQRLAASVHYQGAVTWNQTKGYMSDAYRAARLYLAIFALVGILGLAALLLGLFLGGGRALWRISHGKPASTMHDTEFISLNLRD
ncbi:MAG: DUF6599 family protein [Acidobacteriaceae bacterium]